MDPCTGNTSPEGAPRLHAVPGVDAGAVAAAPDGGAEDVREDLALLRDAATLVTARQRLDGLLLQLIAHPFDRAAYRDLGSYLVGPAASAWPPTSA